MWTWSWEGGSRKQVARTTSLPPNLLCWCFWVFGKRWISLQAGWLLPKDYRLSAPAEGHKLSQGNFCLNVRNALFSMRMTKHWKRLPREGTACPSLEILMPWLGRALDNPIWGPAFKGRLDQEVSRGPFPPWPLYESRFHCIPFEEGPEVFSGRDRWWRKTNKMRWTVFVWLQAQEKLLVEERCRSSQSRVRLYIWHCTALHFLNFINFHS